MGDITLVMIVKNEETTLPRLLRSVKPFISRAIIHDTGSTDNTKSVLKQELEGVETIIRDVEWKSFGENRTQAIKDAGTCGYLLLADADFEYSIHGDVLENLTLDCYQIPIFESGMVYSLPMLVRAGLNWEYVGRTHEYLDSKNYSCGSLTKDKIFIRHHHDGGSRADKFFRDAELLLQDYEQDPRNPRTCFYLGQTFECMNDTQEAIKWYGRRVSLGGWPEEIYVSKLRIGRLEDSVKLLLEAHSYRPQRLEALYEAAIRLRAAPNAVIKLIQYETKHNVCDDILFVEQYVWDYALKFELACAFYSIGEIEAALGLFNQLLANNPPKNYRDYIHSLNLQKHLS